MHRQIRARVIKHRLLIPGTHITSHVDRFLHHECNSGRPFPILLLLLRCDPYQMSSSAGNITLPNPYTPMAFLPEASAVQTTIQTYFAVGSLGALVWDILIHLPQDFKLATQHRMNFPFIVYCISRLSSLAYLVGLVVGATAPIGDCSLIQKLSFTYSVAMPSTLLLFVFRVCALYRNRKCAVVFFSVLWLALLACSIVMPFGISAYTIPISGYCMEQKSRLASAIVYLSPFVHDTIIFLATSWAFISNSSAYQDMTLLNGLRILFSGNPLPAFSRSILRDGQLYYLSSLLLNIVVIVVYHLKISSLTSCTFGVPLFVLMNTLAAHIYRNIRFKVCLDQTITSSALNRNLIGMGAGTTDTEIRPNSSLNPKSNNRDPLVLNISFQRSVTTTSTTGTGTRRHSMGEISSSNSIRGEVGQLDLEKQGGMDGQY